MPHPSRLLAAVCAIAAFLVSLPTDAGIGDKDLPLLNGQKTKLLYTVVGVRDGPSLVTLFHCTSTERESGKTIELGIEVFNSESILSNNVAASNGVVSIPPGHTRTLGTRATNSFAVDDFIDTGLVTQGSARIFATSKNVLCSAMIVGPDHNPPTSMVMLPVFRATKQSGM